MPVISREPRLFWPKFCASVINAIWFWAALAGIVGALATVAFRESIHGLLWLFTRHNEGLVQTSIQLIWWKRLLLPALGGVCGGLILYIGELSIRHRGATEYMEVVTHGDGKINAPKSLCRSTSSLFIVASGNSIGREGAMIELAAMIASLIGRGVGMSAPNLKLLVACGAAAGLASAFNAPLAATIFVAEIVLGSIDIENVGPLVIATVIANTIVHQFFGLLPIYQVPAFHLVSYWELIFYIGLGILAGHLAPIFLLFLQKSKHFFANITLPIFFKIGIGGLIGGILSQAYPEIWGNGYSVVNSILHATWWWQLLLGLLVFKLLATVAIIGSGAVGGVFTPTLFVGAVLGSLTGQLWHSAWPTITAVPNAYAVVGMGAFLAATTHAPLMSILMVFEMTLDYQIMLPLMLACVTAHYVAKVYRGGRSIYADLLQRDQHHSS